MESDYQRILDKYAGESRLRKIPHDRSGAMQLDMVSNDYLGLGARWSEFIPEFNDRFANASFSSSASRLLSQHQKYHIDLENLLENLYKKSVLLFNSGYHANVGIAQALNIKDSVFLPDKLIHASMIDGLSLAGAEFHRWKHNDIIALKKLLEKYSDVSRCVVMIESVYSMDGDIAPIKEIVNLKKRYPNLIIYLDEAHGFGCFGKKGLGLAEELGTIDDIDILVGTLGKAAASSGAFVATTEVMKEYFINTSRSFIFSTAIPPVNAAWSQLMVERILGMEEERAHLKSISKRFRENLESITGEENPSASQIVPLMIGDARKAMQVSSFLTQNGIDALAIRRPTVPPGGERIRFSLSSRLSEKDIDSASEIISEYVKTLHRSEL